MLYVYKGFSVALERINAIDADMTNAKLCVGALIIPLSFATRDEARHEITRLLSLWEAWHQETGAREAWEARYYPAGQNTPFTLV